MSTKMTLPLLFIFLLKINVSVINIISPQKILEKLSENFVAMFSMNNFERTELLHIFTPSL